MEKRRKKKTKDEEMENRNTRFFDYIGRREEKRMIQVG